MQKVEFWENLYGLDFSCLWPVALKEFFSKPKFSHRLAPEDCLSVITLDMHMVQVSDLEKLRGEFCFPVESPGTPHAFSAWFVAKFNNEGGLALKLSTGPCAKPTHWKQTLHVGHTNHSRGRGLHRRVHLPEQKSCMEAAHQSPYSGV